LDITAFLHGNRIAVFNMLSKSKKALAAVGASAFK
jgi:hypothetical protein